MKREQSQHDIGLATRDMERELTRMIACLDGAVLGWVCGLIAGVGLFAMTAILVIEDGPDTGAHLKLLANYFPGYSVSWHGAFIGFLWAFASGALAGWMTGYLYNRVVGLRRKTSMTGKA